MDIFVYVNVLILSTEDIIFIRADGTTLMFEGKHIATFNRIFLENIFLDLKSREFQCLSLMDENTVMFFVLTVEHLPHLHRAALKIAISRDEVLIAKPLLLIHAKLFLKEEEGKPFVEVNLDDFAGLTDLLWHKFLDFHGWVDDRIQEVGLELG